MSPNNHEAPPSIVVSLPLEKIWKILPLVFQTRCADTYVPEFVTPTPSYHLATYKATRREDTYSHGDETLEEIETFLKDCGLPEDDGTLYDTPPEDVYQNLADTRPADYSPVCVEVQDHELPDPTVQEKWAGECDLHDLLSISPEDLDLDGSTTNRLGCNEENTQAPTARETSTPDGDKDVETPACKIRRTRSASSSSTSSRSSSSSSTSSGSSSSSSSTSSGSSSSSTSSGSSSSSSTSSRSSSSSKSSSSGSDRSRVKEKRAPSPRQLHEPPAKRRKDTSEEERRPGEPLPKRAPSPHQLHEPPASGTPEEERRPIEPLPKRAPSPHRLHGPAPIRRNDTSEKERRPIEPLPKRAPSPHRLHGPASKRRRDTSEEERRPIEPLPKRAPSPHRLHGPASKRRRDNLAEERRPIEPPSLGPLSMPSLVEEMPPQPPPQPPPKRKIMSVIHATTQRPRWRSPPSHTAKELLEKSFNDKSNKYIRPFEATGAGGWLGEKRSIVLVSPPPRLPRRRTRQRTMPSVAERQENTNGPATTTTAGVKRPVDEKRRRIARRVERTSPPNTTATVEDHHCPLRLRLEHVVVAPTSNKLLFVDALVEDGVCFGFAAATRNTFCEGYGVPYDIRNHSSLSEAERSTRSFSPATEKILHRRNFTRSFVNPGDIVRFAMRNTQPLPMVVGCGLENLFGTERGRAESFFAAFCRLEPVAPTVKNQHVCFKCFSSPSRKTIVATYVSKTTSRLYCRLHARPLENREDFLLYLPIMLSIDTGHDGSVRLSTSHRAHVIDDPLSPYHGQLYRPSGNKQGGGEWTTVAVKRFSGMCGVAEKSTAVERLVRIAGTAIGAAEMTTTAAAAAVVNDPVRVVRFLQEMYGTFTEKTDF